MNEASLMAAAESTGTKDPKASDIVVSGMVFTVNGAARALT